MFAAVDVQQKPRDFLQREVEIHQTLADCDQILISGHEIMEFILREPGVDPLMIETFARSWDDLTARFKRAGCWQCWSLCGQS